MIDSTPLIPSIRPPSVKVLIVEDERIVAEDIAEELKAQGYEIVGIVSSGESAIQQATATCPDLVLMDIKLQGNINGIAAAEQIGLQLQCPVIYLTANADDVTFEQAKLTEPYAYLLKPVIPQTLRVTLELALQKHRSDMAKRGWYQTQLEASETKLNQLMSCDQLTNLPNLPSLQEQFDQIVRDDAGDTPAADASGYRMAVFCLSLDRFERLNLHLGFSGGDRLVQAVAERLTSWVVAPGMVARTEMNEFVMVLPQLESRSQAMAAAESLLQEIAQPLTIANQKVFITASLGIGFYPRDGSELETLLQKSRRAMTTVQQQGGNRFQVCAPEQQSSIADQLLLETDLYYALERQELHLHYQPKVDLQTGQIVGAESLLRWQHPQRGAVSPAEFIPLAEETRLIESMGEWVVLTACQQLRRWQEQGFSLARIAVNLSGCQLNQPDLQQRLSQILRDTHLNPDSLELELTESILVQKDIKPVLQDLKALGFQLAIDDFGTGYASLSYLQQFPFDILKLDRSFVENVDQNPKNAAIVSAVIAMAHQLNLRVVAEGVETEAELAFLRQNGCDEIQGYLFSCPLPVANFAQLLRSDKRLAIAN